MTTNEPTDKNRIARELGWDSYDDAPPVVQRVIDDSPNADVLDDVGELFEEVEL